MNPPAAADCETIGAGFLAQPVNSLSTIAFILVAILIWRRGSRRFGWIIAGVGVGSFLFHGPWTDRGEGIHDFTLALGLLELVRPPRFWLIAAGLAGLFAVLPVVADPISGGLAVGAIVTVLAAHKLRAAPALTVAGVGALVGRLSATGGPWCFPDSIFQGHAFWHLAAAVALGMVALLEVDRWSRRP